ncbi:hypothetical protein ED733_000998 [Metarhizium rileyi]|uniref:DUF676 domain-containing protein n=1 Tax=Metarhizium rileyi (strain RCEF 4871) TaxID=1649241 RepID=A0A5C6G9I3_METRR|nr:hypothetical protein ED733_000998 [Metarhizium rileyi]
MSSPPPLPPRASSHLSPCPHAKSPLHISDISDPRISSTQSLAPSEAPLARRRLLLIYIHGFYGNDQSFRSFPAHVHALVKELLVDTHVIHSKIYPRYKTYKAIEVARDNFSAWLEPHEGHGTDVVLVGHSMGGLLAGEIILMPNKSPYKSQPFKHKILGTIALDSPFLGLHPGIVVSGIASLFQPSSNAEDQKQPQCRETRETLGSPPGSDSSSMERLPSIDSHIDLIDTEASPSPLEPSADPYFDPPYYNDTPFREQPLVKRLVNFAAKHKREGLLNAVGRHITSHLEFGGCLADYRGLHVRYNTLRALEDVDEIKAKAEGHPAGAYARVRFVNYYTLSPGRPKPAKAEEGEAQEAQVARGSSELQLTDLHIQDTPVFRSVELDSSDALENQAVDCIAFDGDAAPQTANVDHAQGSHNQPNEQLENPCNNALVPHANADDAHRISMQEIDANPLAEADTQEAQHQTAARTTTTTTTDDLDLSPIPNLSRKPTLPDTNAILDKDARKQAEKESRRLQKAYAQAVKDRAKAIQEREKLQEKRHRKASQEAEKQVKSAEKMRLRREREEARARVRKEKQASDCLSSERNAHQDDNGVAVAERAKKLKRFCALPSTRGGAADAAWVDVYMDGMDEVSAHCGLFLPGPHYDQLVGDVGSRVAAWVGEELSKRAVLQAG